MDAITAMLPVSDFPEDSYLLMLTERGFIKRTALSLFKDQALKKGLTAIKLKVARNLPSSLARASSASPVAPYSVVHTM